MGSEGRKKVEEKFLWDNIVEGIERTYRFIIARKNR